MFFLPGRRFTKLGRRSCTLLPFVVPAAEGFVPGIRGSRTSGIVETSGASRHERPSGKEKNCRQTLFIELTRRNARNAGSKKILTTGNNTGRATLSIENATGGCSTRETSVPGAATSRARIVL